MLLTFTFGFPRFSIMFAQSHVNNITSCLLNYIFSRSTSPNASMKSRRSFGKIISQSKQTLSTNLHMYVQSYTDWPSLHFTCILYIQLYTLYICVVLQFCWNYELMKCCQIFGETFCNISGKFRPPLPAPPPKKETGNFLYNALCKFYIFVEILIIPLKILSSGDLNYFNGGTVCSIVCL